MGVVDVGKVRRSSSGCGGELTRAESDILEAEGVGWEEVLEAEGVWRDAGEGCNGERSAINLLDGTKG